MWPWSILIWLILFAGIPTLTHANNFYGTESLKPMVEESETTIHILGGAKLAIQADETKYTLTDHLGSTRLAIASDHEVSRATDYTPFGDTPSDTTLTAKAGRYTGQAYEPESATYDYHARVYDPSIGRFGSPDAIRESISPYSYTENNPVVFLDRAGNGRVPFSIRTGISTGYGSYQSSYLLNKELAKLFDSTSRTRFFDSDEIFNDIPSPGSVTGSNGEIYRLNNIIIGGNTEITFNNHLFWIVGDDKEMSETSKTNLVDTISRLRSVKNDLAENIILFDFSRTDDRSNLETVEGALREMNLPFEVIKRIYHGERGRSTYQFGDNYYESANDMVADIGPSLKQSVSIPETTTPSQTIAVSIPETTTPSQTMAVQAGPSTQSDSTQPSSRGSARPHPYKRKTPRQPEPLFTENGLEVPDVLSLFDIEEPPRLRAPFTERDMAFLSLFRI